MVSVCAQIPSLFWGVHEVQVAEGGIDQFHIIHCPSVDYQHLQAAVFGHQRQHGAIAHDHNEVARLQVPPEEVGVSEGERILRTHGRIRIFLPVPRQVHREFVFGTLAVGRAGIVVEEFAVEVTEVGASRRHIVGSVAPCPPGSDDEREGGTRWNSFPQP